MMGFGSSGWHWLTGGQGLLPLVILLLLGATAIRLFRDAPVEKVAVPRRNTTNTR